MSNKNNILGPQGQIEQVKESKIKKDNYLLVDDIEINNKIIEAISIKTGHKFEKLDMTKNASKILNLLKHLLFTVNILQVSTT